MRVEAGPLVVEVEPLMDDQELDALASTGTIYWEGAVRVKQGEKAAGRGYLELTGYWKPLKL
jgi:predicted secreted hydrolase